MENKSILFNWMIITLIIFSCNSPKPEQADNLEKINSYVEQHRPQFHFSPEEKWMNDPNGMVYFEGEYHLFYQHYPDGIVWGPMHWGHAISKDLVYWEHLPIAFYPDSLGYYFSGSAVIDYNNSSGFGDGKTPPMVAIFTLAWEDEKGIPQRQGIAYSLDKGRTWGKYEGNPVLNEGLIGFRDPKVFWHEASQKWVMSIVAANDNNHIIPDHVRFYTSDNLKEWTKTGEFGYTYGAQGAKWECPDLLEMNVEGTDEKKWVLIVSIDNFAPNGGSGTQYFIGNFDGKTFSLDSPEEYLTGKGRALWLDYGRDNYAGVTWSNAPDGKDYLMGWMSNWKYAQQVPTEKWRSAMTIPRELSLRNTEEGIRLFSLPIPALEVLRQNTKKLTAVVLNETEPVKDSLGNGLAEMVLEFDLSEASEALRLGVLLKNRRGEQLDIYYLRSEDKFYVDRTKSGKTDFSPKFPSLDAAPRLIEEDVLKLHLFVDKSSVEVFADDGSVVMTEIFFPNEDFSEVAIYGNEDVELISGDIYSLESIWNK